MNKKKITKKIKKTKEVESEKYHCVGCGFMTNGDFQCKCGNILCESCSDDICCLCEEEKERREDKRFFDRDDYFE